jgi:hypothetical protein
MVTNGHQWSPTVTNTNNQQSTVKSQQSKANNQQSKQTIKNQFSARTQAGDDSTRGCRMNCFPLEGKTIPGSPERGAVSAIHGDD